MRSACVGARTSGAPPRAATYRLHGGAESSCASAHPPVTAAASRAQQRQQQQGGSSRQRRRLAPVTCLAPTLGLPPSTDQKQQQQQCIELAARPGGARVFLFGAVHGELHSPEIAAFILQQRPAAVVVETAINTAHGWSTGTVMTREEVLMLAPIARGAAPKHENRSGKFAQLGAQLADMANPLGSSLWHDLTQGSLALNSEQLVYVAAFAVGAQLWFGDRPKRTTYRRMLWLPSLEDLDRSFGLQSAVNYQELSSGAPRCELPANDTVTQRALIHERDAVLCASLAKAAEGVGLGGCVVGAVGASHVPGMVQQWESGQWLAWTQKEDLGAAPEGPVQPERPDQSGVRRALFDGVIRLTCRHDVLRDITKALPPLPPESEAAHACCSEIYGSSRMLLAALDREQLGEVCQGWRCDMWEALHPLRGLRPINGGPGYCEDLQLELRALNFELPSA